MQAQQLYTAPSIVVLAGLSNGFYLPGPHYVLVEGEDGVLPMGLFPPVGYDSVPNFSGRGYAILDYGHSDNVSGKFTCSLHGIAHFFTDTVSYSLA